MSAPQRPRLRRTVRPVVPVPPAWHALGPPMVAEPGREPPLPTPRPDAPGIPSAPPEATRALPSAAADMAPQDPSRTASARAIVVLGGGVVSVLLSVGVVVAVVAQPTPTPVVRVTPAPVRPAPATPKAIVAPEPVVEAIRPSEPAPSDVVAPAPIQPAPPRHERPRERASGGGLALVAADDFGGARVKVSCGDAMRDPLSLVAGDTLTVPTGCVVWVVCHGTPKKVTAASGRVEVSGCNDAAPLPSLAP